MPRGVLGAEVEVQHPETLMIDPETTPADSFLRAISDLHGHMVVFMTHNTDFGDAFEREGDDHRYFDQFAAAGYAVGIDVLLYALTH